MYLYFALRDCTIWASCCSDLRIGAVAIAPRRTILDQEHYKHYCPDYGDKSDENPPPAAIGVVKSSYGYRNARDQNRQAVDSAQQTYVRRRAEGADNTIDNRKHPVDDGGEKDKVPILPTPGPSPEHGVLLQCLYVPAHSLPTPYL